MRSVQEYIDLAVDAGIPFEDAKRMAGYIVYGNDASGFFVALYSGDLYDTYARADSAHRERLPILVQFLASNAPLGCYGSRRNYEEWMRCGGLEGLVACQS